MKQIKDFFNRIKPVYLRYGVLAFLAFMASIFLFITSIYAGLWGKIPSRSELADLKYQRATEVYSADSVLIGKFYRYDRQPVAYEAFPDYLIAALVSIEDERFYEHSGIDYPSLFRVALKTVLMQDQSAGGGSTLTQQLAKNLYPRSERKKVPLVVNKVKEMIMASRLESLFSKEALLTRYLNTVSFGDNTFGIESASRKFYNKSTPALRLEEAAVLVGMLKATYGYNPRVFPENSMKRRNLVLESMQKNEMLTKKEQDSLRQLPLALNYQMFDYNAGLAPYFREEVRKQLLSWTQTEEGGGHDIYTDGLKIYTTLDYRMQELAEAAMKSHMAKLQSDFEKSYGKGAPWLKNKAIIDKAVRSSAAYKKLIAKGISPQQAMDSLGQKRQLTLSDWTGEKQVTASVTDSIQHYMKFLNTGSLSIDAKTGAVKTWIGGVDFEHFKFDHVAQSKRQVGSTFKPIVYTAALEMGIPPCAYFSASEVAYENLKGWSPSNSGNKDETYLNYSMEEALSNSVNTVAVKVLEATGIKNVLAQAKNMGVFSPLPEQPSVALGTGEIYMNELAGAYASYVNNGKAVYPYLIKSIYDKKDSLLVRFEPKRAKKPAFSKQTRQTMIEMMKATIDRGTAKRIRTTYGLTNAIAGKTGTTQNNKDAWFVALTPKLVHVTWVGHDNHQIGFKTTGLGQGANAALPIFALWYKALEKEKRFHHYTRATFERPMRTVQDQLACPPIKKDGFFKRLFKNPNKKKSKRFRSRG
ncbi:transglycosylase domain-containing protein [Maribacter sp. 2-571]|uniref:transglycosylase domain-containing protein n=1 Tax=Maribacter sp. 2-571 TaxID=3417569 RepID=UPI003D3576E1